MNGDKRDWWYSVSELIGRKYEQLGGVKVIQLWGYCFRVQYDMTGE